MTANEYIKESGMFKTNLLKFNPRIKMIDFEGGIVGASLLGTDRDNLK